MCNFVVDSTPSQFFRHYVFYVVALFCFTMWVDDVYIKSQYTI